MLSARKLHLVAGLKVQGLYLRQAEVDFYMLRYVTVAGLSSMMTGMAYIGLIKIKIPEVMQEKRNEFVWQVFVFYTSTSAMMALSLFNLFLTSFLVVNAQGLMLRGPPNSVLRCVEILSANWLWVRATLSGSLLCLVLSAISITWMKLDDSEWYPGPATICSVLVLIALVAAVQKMHRMAAEFRIPANCLVSGDLTIEQQQQQQQHLQHLQQQQQQQEEQEQQQEQQHQQRAQGDAMPPQSQLEIQPQRIDLMSENMERIAVSNR